VRSFVWKAALSKLISWHWITTHATVFNTFALDVLNYLQKKMVDQCCTSTSNFCFLCRLKLFQSTAHSTLHNLTCKIMPCLVEN